MSDDTGTGIAVPVLGTTMATPQLAVAVVAVLGFLTLPFWAGNGMTYVMAYASIWAVFAAGWDIISGHTGYISFGHSLLSGSAAYTTALLIYNVDPNMSLALTIPASIVVALVVGMVFGLPSLRLRGPYFSLVTFASVLVAMKLIQIFSQYTNGELGIQGVSVFSYDTTVAYYIMFGLAVVVGLVLLGISRSNVGRVLRAISEREQTVEEAGLDTTKFKLWAFAVSAVVMSLGGVFLAHFYGNVSPANVLENTNSILMIAMAAVGGTGTIVGPMAGAYLLVFLRDTVFQSIIPLGTNQRFVALWVIAIAFLVLTPEGIFVRLWAWLGGLGGGGADE